MNSDLAMVIALNALGHIAGDDALLERFCRESGLAPAALRTEATKPAFLAGVMDFMLADEARLMDFCTASGLAPEEPARARRALPGGGFDDV